MYMTSVLPYNGIEQKTITDKHKIVDFGCGEGKMLSYLRDITSVEELVRSFSTLNEQLLCMTAEDRSGFECRKLTAGKL
jgi:hypothetical protein